MPAHPFLDHAGPIPFAHRGGAGDHPENTMRAFDAAVALGYRYLETDARATRDGVLLAFHDSTLDRVTDRTGRIDELPYDEVRRARVAGTEEILRLEHLFEAHADARFNVDAKTAAAVEPLVELIRRTNSIDRVCVGSFDSSSLRRIASALGPGVCTVATIGQVARVRAASWLPVPGLRDMLARSSAHCYQVPVRHRGWPVTDRAFVGTAHRIGRPVHVWTVDDAAEMHRLLDLGVDGLMTDRPAVLKEVLAQRGQWVG